MSEENRTAGGACIHSAEDFASMQLSGRKAAEVLDEIEPYIKAGVTTEYLDDMIHTLIKSKGAVTACLGYKGYPKISCISVNHVVCHGIPDGRLLKSGDILNIDVGLIFNGWYGDTSRMYAVGKPSVRAGRLLKIAHTCLMKGIEATGPGRSFLEIGRAIRRYAESQGCSVVDGYVGHGVGKQFHDMPIVCHVGKTCSEDLILPGMIFTIEPMINLGKPGVKILSDGWTVVTRDMSLSAQFEHTVGIMEDGVVIMTESPADKFFVDSLASDKK